MQTQIAPANINDNKWVKQDIENLKNDPSLLSKDIEMMITNAIAEYVVGTIGVFELIEFVDALKNYKSPLSKELKYIISDLDALHQYKSDKQYVHNILIDVLRKITKT